MPDFSYDQVRYPTYPRIETHPDRLAAMAVLYGMSPAPVTECRVLELGCGDGGNLIPMAYFLPGSRFLGVDLSGAAVSQARALIRRLRLRNIEVRRADLRSIGGSGPFDYVIAHGLYSWVPSEVRDGLMELCRSTLAPQGVAYISYNELPGRAERHRLREVLLDRLRGIRTPRSMLREARRLLREIGTPEAQRMAEASDDILFHDDLAPVNDPVTFRQFVSHARRCGLAYLAEARTGPPPGGFRQSLLCRDDVKLDRRPSPSLMSRFLFSIESPGEARSAVAMALRDAYPLPLPYCELEPYDRRLSKTLWSLFRAGSVNLHVFDFPCEETVTARPRATRLARVQAEHSRLATGVRHHLVELTRADRALLRRLDGRRRIASPRLEWFARMGLLEG